MVHVRPSLTLFVFLLASSPFFAPPARAGDGLRTEAPRLVVVSQQCASELVPLKETSAEIQIAGAVAAVEVRQVFENTGTTPIEALYVFPASTRAAVHAMRMKIGARTIEAVLDRKAKAREAFEAARAQGQRASLLEEERPNVFTMRVTNIMPKDRIEVSLRYSELLVPEDGTYELVYPTVVGPRYQGGASEHARRWMSSPTTAAGVAPLAKLALHVHLDTGVPLEDVSSPSHPVAISSVGTPHTDVTMTDPAGGNRDFVLRYRLAGDRIETGALLAPVDPRDDGAGTFALLVEPPRAPKLAELPPREYLFLLDVSGSMHGFPLDTAKTLMRQLLPTLRPIDAFDVALFSGAAHVMNPGGSVPATKENVARALALIEQEQGGGGTELMGGLEMTYRIPRADAGVSRTVVVVTDGFVGVEAQAFAFVRQRLGEANLFAFGIGASVNRHLIEGLARAGLGEPFVVSNPDEAAAQVEKLRKTIEEPVLTHIAVAFEGLDVRDWVPQAIPDLLARRPLTLLGKYRGAPRGKVIITGLAGGHTPFRKEVVIGPADVQPSHAPLRALWARRAVAAMEDDLSLQPTAALEEAITSLGLHYGLLTPFTSFVAVDSEVVNHGGPRQHVTQPLPLPAGVEDDAAEVQAGSVLGSLSADKVGYGAGLGAVGARRSLGQFARAKGALAEAPSPAKEATPASAKPEPAAPPPATKASRTVTITILDAEAPLSAATKRALTAKLTQALKAVGCLVPGTHALTLTLDDAGRVVSIHLDAGRARETCLVAPLLGLQTGEVHRKTLKVELTVGR